VLVRLLEGPALGTSVGGRLGLCVGAAEELRAGLSVPSVGACEGSSVGLAVTGACVGGVCVGRVLTCQVRGRGDQKAKTAITRHTVCRAHYHLPSRRAPQTAG
jgi:hypothetical protein